MLRERAFEGAKRYLTQVWWIGLLLTAGCDGSLATVSGTLKLDGKRVAGGPGLYGTVSFCREDGRGAPVVGIIDDVGRYSLATGRQQHIEPGKYRVAVSVKKIHPPAQPGGLTRPERISPQKYAKPESSGLTADVKPGSNTFDFAISSTDSQ